MFEKSLYDLGKFAATLIKKARLTTDVVWNEPLPSGPKIIAPNHPTTTDPIWIMDLFRDQLHYIFTPTLGKIGMVRRYIEGAGHVIRNEANGRDTYDQAVTHLQQGKTMAIFPEGQLSSLSEAVRPRTGVVRMALQTGVPIIPVGISIRPEFIRFCDYEVDGEITTARWYMNGPYAVTVGKPIYLTGDVEDRRRVVALSNDLMADLRKLSLQGALRLNQQACVNWRHRPAG